MKKTATVLVTGGTGYVASWLVKDLLEQGHHVRTTVRNKQKTDKYQHLLDIEKGLPGKLTVYEADLLKEGSFDEAVHGCEFVFHTASPFIIYRVQDAYQSLVQPAIEGTRNVLHSVNKADTVKRVILTSSIVAIYGDNEDMKGKSAFTEEDWNTTSSLEHQPYSYSKTLAEQEAWEIANAQNRWDLVTINPGLILGPSLAKRTDSTSITTILSFLQGEYKMGVPDLENGLVDVRDVAKAHRLAAFTTEAQGRYIITSVEAKLLDMARIIENNFPKKYPLPKRVASKILIWLIAPSVGVTRKFIRKNVGYPLKFNNRKSKMELGMSYRALETTLVDQVNQLEEDHVI